MEDKLSAQLQKLSITTSKGLRSSKYKDTLTKEDHLIIIVKKRKPIKPDVLEHLLNNFDPNYYSVVTENSAFSYAVQHENIELVLLILQKMTEEYQDKQNKFFQRDLRNLSRIFDSELFRKAYEKDKKDKTNPDDLIVRFAKALTLAEPYRQNGRRLKNGKKSNFSEYSHTKEQKKKSIEEKYRAERKELKKAIAEDNRHIKHSFESPCFKFFIYICNEIQNEEERRKLKIDYRKKKYNLKVESVLHEVSTFFRQKWKKKFSALKEVQAMLVVHKISDDTIKSQIYVAANPHLQPFVNGDKFKTEDVKPIEESLKSINTNTSLIFAINSFPKQDVYRHAEEILCDKLKELKTPKKAYIYGTKPPCLSCYSRMQMEAEKSDIKLHFSNRYGKFWLHTIKHVGEKHKGKDIRIYRVAINTLKLLATAASSVTEEG